MDSVTTHPTNSYLNTIIYHIPFSGICYFSAASTHPAGISSRLFKAFADQLRQILDGERTVGQDGLVVAAQVELVAKLALEALPQAVERRPADEVGGKLAGRLL